MKDFEKVKDLQTRFKDGEEFVFEFFWKGPFSQWDRCGFTVDGVHYKTAEHWMMAEKARLFGDEETRKKIIESGHPREPKALGREVKGFDEKVWEEHRFEIVLNGNRHKFTQNESHLKTLLATGDKILVEASPVDQIWGIGLAEEDKPAVLSPFTWKGLNLLGFVLTELRDELKE